MQSNFNFRLMTIEFWLRDRFDPPERILQDTGVSANMTLLDLGCGPGGFSLAAAKLVRPKGKVYAVDIHPLALRLIQNAAKRRQLDNLYPLYGDDLVNLPPHSIDMVLLYDILHDLGEPMHHLQLIHELLKPDGIASIKDHHLNEEQIINMLTNRGLFTLADRLKKTVLFRRAQPSGGIS